MDSETLERIVATLLLIGFEPRFKDSIAASGTYYVNYDREVSVFIFRKTHRIDIGELDNHVAECTILHIEGVCWEQIIERIVEEVERWTVKLQEQR